MLFSCVPETGGCEWAFLKVFVARLNTELGTNYVRTACLDVEKRNEKMPEILLEAPGLPPMVVESKVVAWPEDYCRRHSNFHNFANHFAKRLRSRSTGFNGSRFKLRIHEDTLDGMVLRQVRSLADDLALQVHASEGEANGRKGVGGDKPVSWHFGLGRPEEWGEPASSCGISVETVGKFEPDWECENLEIDDEESLWRLIEARNQAQEARRLNAVEGFSCKLDEAIENARRKFEKFDGHKRLLLLSFVGDSSSGVIDEDLIGIVVAAQLPEEIDEMWVAYHNWISEWDYEFAWKRMR